MPGVVVHFWAFLGISVLLIVAPGPDTVLVIKNAALHGRRTALGSALGVNTGLVIWTVGAAVGVAAVIRESAIASTVLKLVGGCHLIWLGLQALRAAQQQVSPDISPSAHQRRELGARSGFSAGTAERSRQSQDRRVYHQSVAPVRIHPRPGPRVVLVAWRRLRAGYRRLAVRLRHRRGEGCRSALKPSREGSLGPVDGIRPHWARRPRRVRTPLSSPRVRRLGAHLSAVRSGHKRGREGRARPSCPRHDKCGSQPAFVVAHPLVARSSTAVGALRPRAVQ